LGENSLNSRERRTVEYSGGKTMKTLTKILGAVTFALTCSIADAHNGGSGGHFGGGFGHGGFGYGGFGGRHYYGAPWGFYDYNYYPWGGMDMVPTTILALTRIPQFTTAGIH
jgi:hypothetical protein